METFAVLQISKNGMKNRGANNYPFLFTKERKEYLIKEK
jgi:hypothetical protein